MSLRSDILGWVIRRLGEIDAADEARRADLFRTLRNEVSSEGFGGAAPADALPHFESAVALQEAYWLREAAARPAPPEATAPKPPRPPKPTKPWQWPNRLSVPDRPPGPAPGEPVGPFSDHIYETVTLAVPGGSAALNLGWTYDPACVLTANSPDIGFSFRTRAASFTHAVDHLEAVLHRAGLGLPEDIRRLDL